MPFLIAAAAVQAAPANPDVIEGAFRVMESDAGVISAAIGEVPRFLAIRCTPGRPRMEVFAEFPETIGFSVVSGTSGGYRVRYSFDGGEERRSAWSATGDMAIAIGAYSSPHDFVRRLRGTNSLVLQVRRQGGGSQRLDFHYPDPTSAIDDLSRRCGITLN